MGIRRSSRRYASARPTGIEAVEPVPWGSHLCQFYRTADDLTEILVPFFQAGLEAGEQCLWIASEPLVAADARAALAAACPDLPERERRGQIEILDHEQWYLVQGRLGPDDVLSGWLEREAAALRAGYEGLRLSGNTYWLAEDAWKDFMRYERRVHECFHERRIVALCSYSLERCGTGELLDVLRNHGLALVRDDREGWSIIHSATALLAEMGPSSVAPSAMVAPATERGGHAARFYEPDSFPAPDVAAFLAAALRAGGAALCIATPAHADAICAELDLDGVLGPARQDGRLVVLNAADLLASMSEGGQLDMAAVERIAAPRVSEMAAAHQPLRVFGEMVDIACQNGRREDALLLERKWNELRRQAPFELLCAYSVAHFEDAASLPIFGRLCDEHDVVQTTARLEAGASSDESRLLACVQQQSRALDRELERRRDLEAEHRQALERARETALHAAATHRHLATLQRITSALSEAATVSDVCSVLHTDIADAMGAATAVLALPTGAGTELLRAAGGEGPLELCIEAHQIGAPVWEGAPAWEGSPGARGNAPPDDATAVAVSLPLVCGNARLGAMGLSFGEARAITPADRALLDDLARQLALALDRAQHYERAEQAREQAEEASRAKDEFLAILGHELRNPLSPMQTALQVMQLRAPGVAVKERAVIERQLDHMVRLVDDLLDVSRITRGSLSLTRRRVELADVVASAIEMASPVLEEKAHRLSTAVPTGLIVHADTHRLAQTVANLLTNAAKYTPSGGIIEIVARTMRDGRLSLSVRDDGIGIEPELLPHIFDSFVQGRQESDRPRGGLGLGLTIVRRLTELHGGTVRAESNGRERGSTFTIELPLASLAPAALSPLAAAAAPEPPADPGPLRILVVDDNRDAADMLAEALRTRRHDVRVAYDGPEALSVVRGFRPDVALLDIGLPVMDGFELAAQLRAVLQQDPPTLMAVTGYGQRADVERAHAAGFAQHFVKPIDFSGLEAALDRVEQARESAAE